MCVKEIWKDLPGWEGYYQVSNQERFRTIGKCYNYKRREIPPMIHKWHWQKIGNSQPYYRLNIGQTQTPIAYKKLYKAAFENGPICYKTFNDIFVKEVGPESIRDKLNRLIASTAGKKIDKVLPILREINRLGAKLRYEKAPNKKRLSPYKITLNKK